MAERVVVVGAGVFGAWTADHLQQQGHQVTLVEAHGPAHARASSGGESRLIRAAYGKDEVYSRMARDSLPQWQVLSDALDSPIFHRHGILFFFAADDPYFADTIAAHRRLGLPTEALDQRAMAARFPMFDFDGIALGLFEPDFGSLMARRAVQSLVERIVRAGGDFLKGQVEPLQRSASILTEIRMSNGERVIGDCFVFALGPWLPTMFPDIVGQRIRPTRQEVFYFAPPAGDRRFAAAAMPGWSDFNGGDMFYGMPDLESRGVKFAFDRHGPIVDPDTQDRRPSDAALAEVIAYRDRRFPLLKGAPLTGAEVCQYENSSTGDLLIDFHPQLANVLLVGGGSGHGFKHGPEVGRYAAGRLFGAATPEPRFSLASKSETHSREIH